MQITQTGDMIEVGSPVWLDTWGIDPRTRAEAERITRELEVVEVDWGSPVDTPFDWYEPWSQPIQERHHVIYEPTVGPLA